MSVTVSRPPAGARLAIARPGDPEDRAILVVPLTGANAVLPTPGLAGTYELRLTAGRPEDPVVLVRRTLVTTEPKATVSAPAKAKRGAMLAVRGIGPNGEQDRVVLVREEPVADEPAPFFYPAENVEAALEIPDRAGAYELRYLMNAPLSGLRVLARQAVTVE